MQITSLLSLILTALMIAPIPAPQIESHPTVAQSAVTLGRSRGLVEGRVVQNTVTIVARHADGTEFYRHTDHNLRTNAGANWQADIMSNTSTPSVNTQCNYIAVTNTAITPGATDTTLSGEIAANGLTRAQGTYAHTSNATSYTIAKTFTASGTQASQATGMFTASSGGTMCFENTYTQVTVNNTDTLTVTWTINF